MEQTILLWCIVAPAIVSLAFFVFSTKTSVPVSSVLLVIGWCAAITVALYARQSKNWLTEDVWPLDAWQQVILPIIIGSVTMTWAANPHSRFAEARWLIAGLAVTAVAIAAMPSGEGWTDMLPLHRIWIGAIIFSGLLNLWFLDRMSRRGAERWVLWIGLAGLGSPAILAASAFAGLAEWVLAASISTLVMAVAASWRSMILIESALYPIVLFSVSAVAAGRFYTYEDHPVWSYGVMLLMPSIIALVDLPLERRSAKLRISVSIATAFFLLICVAWLILRTSTEEQW